jgi:hypothetical protein
MATGRERSTTEPFAREWKDLLEEPLLHQGNCTEKHDLVLTDHGWVDTSAIFDAE